MLGLPISHGRVVMLFSVVFTLVELTDRATVLDGIAGDMISVSPVADPPNRTP